MEKKVATHEETLEFVDYPVSKYGKKVDFWTSVDGISMIAGWRRLGATIEEIYERMGVDPRTFRSWRKKHPELEAALTINKHVTNNRVVNSLYKLANGYDYEEVTEELIEGRMTVTKVVHKHVQPSVKAIMCWLYSRCPEEWRQYQAEIDASKPELLAAGRVLAAIRQAVSTGQIGEGGSPDQDEEVVDDGSDS